MNNISVEFLILLGVSIMILDQIRRIRAAYEQKIAAYEQKIAELQAQVNPDVQAELDAFEAEVIPAPAPAPEA